MSITDQVTNFFKLKPFRAPAYLSGKPAVAGVSNEERVAVEAFEAKRSTGDELLVTHLRKKLDKANATNRELLDKVKILEADVAERDDRLVRKSIQIRELNSRAATLEGTARQAHDAARSLLERANCSPEEANQLGIAGFKIEIIDGKQVATMGEFDFHDMREMLMHSDLDKATKAQFRIVKKCFVDYQNAIKVILDRMEKLGKKNHVSREDYRKLRELREDLSNTIRRPI